MTSAPRADWPTEPLDRMLVPAAAPAATQPATKATQRVRASHGWRALQRPIRPGDIRTARVRPICLRVIPAAGHLPARRRSGLLLVIIVVLRWDQSVPLGWARSGRANLTAGFPHEWVVAGIGDGLEAVLEHF